VNNPSFFKNKKKLRRSETSLVRPYLERKRNPAMKICSLDCVVTRTLVLVAAVTLPWQASAQNWWSPKPAIVTFDAPRGVGTVASGCIGQCGTFPTAIAIDGTIVGNTVDAHSISHGFLRSPSCKIYSIDPPGSVYTAVSDISPIGAVTGYYATSTQTYRGFLRDPWGHYAIIVVPGADKGTFPEYFSPVGHIAGHYSDDAGTHGFVVGLDGKIKTFSISGSALTMPQGVNELGTVAGYYSDGTTDHGFLREASGKVTTVDPPGSSFTIVTGLSGLGTVTGYYFDGVSQYHGFARAANGTFTTFDPPNSEFTIPEAIDFEGLIAGEFFDPDSASGDQGFIRGLDGKLAVFSVPSSAPQNATATMPSAINALGSVTGAYGDTNLQNHGFVRTLLPQSCANDKNDGWL
jgi:hypothetical protein